MNGDPRELRLASWIRGIFITVMIAAYGWLVGQPQAPPTWLLLIGIGLQLLIILLRWRVPAARGSQAQYLFELIADGLTVLTFALGVLGGVVKMPEAI